MASVNSPLLDNFIRLRNQPEFAPFREHLNTEIKEATEACIGLNEDKAIYRAQGAARKLTALKDLIDASVKMRDQKKPVEGIPTADTY